MYAITTGNASDRDGRSYEQEIREGGGGGSESVHWNRDSKDRQTIPVRKGNENRLGKARMGWG